MNTDPNTPVSPRWLHVLAVLTVLCALPLTFLGAGVTSYDVGMVDPRGFRPPWVIIDGLLENSGLAWRLEYGHRTFGFIVGLCGIGLAIGCWFYDRRIWIRWVGFLALTLICVQGALGISRVDLNPLYGRELALVHGAFAQIVFATLVALVLFTSRHWLAASSEPASPALQRWSIITALVVFGQIVLGGLIRHQQDSLLGPRGHLLGAFLVVGAVLWLLKLMRDEAPEKYKTQRIVLMALLALQLWLGVESWLAKFFVESAAVQQVIAPMPTHKEWIRTAHYLVGTLIFSTSVTVVLIAHRKPVAVGVTETGIRKLEGAL